MHNSLTKIHRKRNFFGFFLNGIVVTNEFGLTFPDHFELMFKWGCSPYLEYQRRGSYIRVVLIKGENHWWTYDVEFKEIR